MSVVGHCAPAFSGVAATLSASVRSGADLGAQVAVICDGEVMVDLSAGHRDRQQQTPFADSLVCVYSVGKAVLAALAMEAVDLGLLSYDQPIADAWPDYAAHGKSVFTVGDALSHQTALPAFLNPIDPALWTDWPGITEALAAETPLWVRGDGCGYHPQTFGFIVGEVLRRVTGDMPGDAMRRLGPDLFCGLTEVEMPRVGPMIKPPAAPDLGAMTPLKRAAFMEKWSSPSSVLREVWQAAQIPASNTHATASALARVMQAFATGESWGGRTISQTVRAEAMAERVRAEDRVLPFELSWAAGVMRNHGGHYGPSATAIGHYGFGGACVVADPAHGMSFAYVPNKMSAFLVRDPRAMSLIDAVYTAL